MSLIRVSLNTQRYASALILVIMTLALMVTVAVSFMSIVGNRQGNAVAVALQTHAELAMQQSQAHVIRLLNESMKEIRDGDGNVNAFNTYRNAPYLREFWPLVDEDANPWTDDRKPRTPTNKATLQPTTNTASAHPLINTNITLKDMRHTSSGTPNYYRWHNVAWLTGDLKRIDMDLSLPEADRIKLMKSARYVVRYTAQVQDDNAFLAMNNNYPDTLSTGESINRGSAATDSVHYIRQQNYLRNFGRSLKSMLSSSRAARQPRMQLRSDKNLTRNDPLDLETVSVNDYGSRLSHAAGPANSDVRTTAERMFRGGDLSYSGAGMPNYMHKGRQYTWLHATKFSYAYMGQAFAPYAESIRDEDMADVANGDPVGPVSTPWRVNMLTASNAPTLRIMLSGLSSHVRLNEVSHHNADLFGLRYPEPFPLDFDAGRSHTLVSPSFGRPKLDVFWNSNGGGGYRNSYINDAVYALAFSIQLAKAVWGEGASLHSSITSSGCYLDATTLTNTDAMTEQVMRETYRILGEHEVNAGAGSVRTGSFLAGDEVTIGDGRSVNRNCQISPTANSRAMEYFLNDMMISLFGKANPDFTVGDAVTNDSIALDFNQDGYAESTVTGWYDHANGRRVWSWWWDGLGPYVRVADQNDYMKRPGWYRFYAGDATPYRKIGGEWKAVPDVATFYEYNDLWLKNGGSYPIKPFSKTGRLFIGKSRYFSAFMRAEVYDKRTELPVADVNRTFSYMLDPNNDGDYSDNALLLQGEMIFDLTK